MDLTPKQQTSEAIRQAETILITTGQHPSVDQVAAVIGLTAILRKFGKNVTAVISDSLPQSVNLLDTAVVERNMAGSRDFVLKLDVSKAEVDKLRYEVIDNKLNVFITPYKGNFAPSDVTFDYGESHFAYDLAIVLGVPTRVRIDRVYEQSQASFEQIPLVNLDFHRSNENYGAVNLIEPNASSLCEMLVALAESLQGGIIDEQIATALLMGIVASTDRFTAAHTTRKSLTVAAQMMAAGARQQAVVKALYRDGKSDQRGERSEPRGGGEQRNAERNRSNDSRQDRQSEPRQERQSEQPVRHESSARTESPRTEAARQPEQPRREVQREQREQDEPRARVSEPIIAPGHIELSEPESASDMPARPELVRSEPKADAEPAQPSGQMTMPVGQPTPPMADFAAAAEILAQRQHDEGDRSEPQS